MPIISSFTGIAARGFGFTNGLPPLPPTDISFVTSEINAVVTFSTSPTSYPVDIVQAKIMQGATLISDWATVTSGGNISASNLTPVLLYTAYFRTRDTGGQISQEVSQTFTTSTETPPGAPTFSLAVASGDAGTFKFNITWTAGTAGTYSRTTQYRIETSAGAQLLDWTTISSSPIAYGADTYNGAGALTPSTTYSVRLRSVANTSGTITNAAYQTVTTNAIVAPNAPTSLSAAPVAGTPGEFSFTFSHTPGTARSYPVYGSQYRIRTNNSGTITYLSGYSSYQDFSGTVTIGTSSYVGAILTPGSTYYIDTRTYDTLGTFSTVTSTSVTLTAQRVPGAPTFSLAVASGDAGTFKFNITSTGGTIGSYPRITQYRIEDSAGEQLKDWATISSNSSTVTAYGADTYNGAGALTPGTTYRVRLKSVADTSGTITYSSPAYQTVTTNAIDAPNAPTSLSAAPVTTGYQGEFSFEFSHTPGTATTYPVSGSQYRIRTNDSGTITYLSGYSSYQNFSGIIAIGTSTYLGAILTPGSTYYIDTRTYDTQGNYSAVTSTSVTLTAQRVPGAPTFSLAVASGDAGTFKFNITSTGGTIGSYPRITQYRIEDSAGEQLKDWATISSNLSTVTAYGADTYNGAGALTPITTYRVRLKSVADTSGTITYSSPAYQTVTTNAIVAPNAPTTTAAPVAGTPGEFSFAFSHTPGTARSYPVSGSQYRVRSNNTEPYTYVTGYSTYQNFSAPVTIGTSSYVGAILTPGSTYYIDTRTYDTQGNYSAVTSTSVTLTAERVPGVPNFSLAVASGDAGTFKFNITSTGGTIGSYPRITQYRIEDSAGAQLLDWATISSNSSTVTTYGADTYNVAGALTPGTTYRVRLKSVADTSGTITYSSPAYQEVTTNASVAPTISSLTVAAPEYNGTNTSTLNVGFNSAPGSWPISSYEYSTNAGTNWKIFSGSAPATTTYSISVVSSSNTALGADTTYTVHVRAVDTQGNVSTSAIGTPVATNAPVPATPAFTSNGMSNNSAGTVNVFVYQPAYAERAFVQVSTSSTFAAGVTTYNSDTHTANFTFSGANSRWAFSLSNQAYGTTIYYRAYVRNRHGGSTGQSGNSTTRTWVTPTKDVAKVWTANVSGQTYYANYTYVIPTNACEPYRLAITFPSSGIGATENDVGYQRVDMITALMRCGNQLTRPSDGANFQAPTTTANKLSLCNITDLRFSYATIGSESSANGAKPLIYTGDATLGSSAEELVYRTVSVGGTSLHNKVFMVTVETGLGYKSWGSGCVLSLKGDYFSGKQIQLTGVETTPGSFS